MLFWSADFWSLIVSSSSFPVFHFLVFYLWFPACSCSCRMPFLLFHPAYVVPYSFYPVRSLFYFYWSSVRRIAFIPIRISIYLFPGSACLLQCSAFLSGLSRSMIGCLAYLILRRFFWGIRLFLAMLVVLVVSDRRLARRWSFCSWRSISFSTVSLFW